MKILKHPIIPIIIFLGLTSIIPILAATATISAKEADKHINEYATVSGKVFKVFVSKKGTIFLNIDGEYPNQPFSGVIFSDKVSQFNGGIKEITAYEDKNVLISGKIQEYKGKPEIIITSTSQIKLAEGQ